MMLLGKILFGCCKSTIIRRIVLPMHIDLTDTRKALTLRKRNLKLNVKVQRKAT